MAEVVIIEPNISKEENEVILRGVIEILEEIAQEIQGMNEAWCLSLNIKLKNINT